ncbi:PREDICTED: uncharacterized protein LOC106811976 [Priapulus caudatus]|uniref:Uncharacterized protein LOC106811976 n=1 Tax=Priapulus caudatus TaxID=37621 RepID=A0ABM1EG86_PRICU|nr:PREDICTED: uncharacterized protein LOC106811976 [Priapulus caudatus]
MLSVYIVCAVLCLARSQTQDVLSGENSTAGDVSTGTTVSMVWLDETGSTATEPFRNTTQQDLTEWNGTAYGIDQTSTAGSDSDINTSCSCELGEVTHFPRLLFPASIPVAGQASILIIVVLYLLVAMVITLDDCFVPAIERFCQASRYVPGEPQLHDGLH